MLLYFLLYSWYMFLPSTNLKQKLNLKFSDLVRYYWNININKILKIILLRNWYIFRLCSYFVNLIHLRSLYFLLQYFQPLCLLLFLLLYWSLTICVLNFLFLHQTLFLYSLYSFSDKCWYFFRLTISFPIFFYPFLHFL